MCSEFAQIKIKNRLPTVIVAEGEKSNISGFVVTERLQKLILAYSALGVVATGTLVAGLSMLPLYRHLKQDQEKTLLWLVETKTIAVEEYLWQVNRLAWQIVARSAMPLEIEAYNQGKLSREALAKLSQPKLEYAHSQSEEIAGITRLDGAGKLAIAVGLPVPAEIWPLLAADSKTTKVYGPVFLKGAAYWVLGVPILNQQAKPVGTDIFLLKPNRLQRLLEDSGNFNKTATTILGGVRPDGKIAFFPLGYFKQDNNNNNNINIYLQYNISIAEKSALSRAIKKAVREDKGLLTDKLHEGSQKQNLFPIGNSFFKASEAVIAYSRIKGSNWGLVIKVDAKELYASVYSQIREIGIAMFALSGLFAAGMIFVLRPIAKKSLNQKKELQQLIEEKTADLQAQQNQRAFEVLRGVCAGEERGNAKECLWKWNLEQGSIFCLSNCQTQTKCVDCAQGTHADEWFKHIHPDDVERVKAEITIHIAGVTSYFQSEYRVIQPDGSYRWMRARGVAIRDSNGKAICIEGTTCDITASKEAIREATPQESEKNLRLAAFPINNPNPVLATDQWGNITYMNPAAERLLSKIGISEPLGFLPENHAAIARRCLECGQGESQIEVTVAVRKAALQEQRVFSWSYHPVPELNTVHLYGIDITERQWAEEQLLQAALHDGLTGLPNRTLFIHRLEAAIARAKKNPSYLFAVLFLDLDRFKVVNDSLGHVLGDRFLIAIARRLETCLRPGDVVARMGGDEFTILLCGFTDISVVNRFAERILKELSLPINLNGYEVFTTASIGITIAAYSQKPGIEDILARPYEQPEELLRDADLAMYRAKAEGKARYVIFDSTMHKRAVALLQMENELRRALNESGKPVLLQGGIPSQETSHPAPFVLYYQPIVALDTGRIAGFEALVRWIHPERGLISPSEFIPVAEESGLIVPLGNWVLLEACRQLRQWQEKFPAARELTISVNLSGKQLSQPDLLSQIDSILQQTGIDAYCLKLEITESVLMDNAAAAVALLEQLRARNIGLCIDDFGTGYSSLSYLHRFPINTLKIDRSFVVEMGGDNENSEIARAIVMLAHNLGMYVVAEGVETEQHLVQLWAMQCEYAQGYFFSKPLDSKAAEELIAAEPQW